MRVAISIYNSILQGGNVIDYSSDLIVGHLFSHVLHDFVFSQSTAVLEHLCRYIVSMLTGEPWLGVDSFAAVTVADSASLNVTGPARRSRT